MANKTEYDRLFGVDGTYTSARAQSRQNVDVIRGPYAGLIEELHAAGIDVYKTNNKRVNGCEPKRHEFEIDNDVLSREFVIRRMRND